MNKLAQANYQDNLKIEAFSTANLNSKTLINNQAANYCRNFKIGSRDLARAGCGPVAIYNFLIIKNKKLKLSRIIYDLETKTLGVLFNGAWGTNPFVIKLLLKNYGFNSNLELVTNNNLKRKIGNNKFSILVYSKNKGLRIDYVHYILIEKRGTDYLIYNSAEQGDTVTKVISIVNYLEEVVKIGKARILIKIN